MGCRVPSCGRWRSPAARSAKRLACYPVVVPVHPFAVAGRAAVDRSSTGPPGLAAVPVEYRPLQRSHLRRRHRCFAPTAEHRRGGRPTRQRGEQASDEQLFGEPVGPARTPSSDDGSAAAAVDMVSLRLGTPVHSQAMPRRGCRHANRAEHDVLGRIPSRRGFVAANPRSPFNDPADALGSIPAPPALGSNPAPPAAGGCPPPDRQIIGSVRSGCDSPAPP